MGCAQSTAISQEPGAFAPFSAGSFATLDTKLQNKTYEKVLLEDNRGSSLTICEGYGISRSKPFHIAIANSNERLSGYETAADGARLTLGPENQLSLVFASFLPLNAPCALYTKQVSGVNNLVVQGVCNLVDVYITVDGEPQEDGHICSGDGSNDNAAAIADAVNKRVPSSMEAAIQKMLETGPSGPTPWATLVASDRNFKGEHFVYIPLMAAQGDSVDDMMIDECQNYAEGLMAHFATLLSSIGPGEHEFQIRISPRSAVTTGENTNIDGPGQTGSSGIGVYPESVLDSGDEGFTQFVQSELESQLGAGGISAADVAGMRARFTLDVDAALCSGTGPERLAQPFAEFAADVPEHCELVMEIAHTGVMGAAAAQILGQSPGEPTALAAKHCQPNVCY